MTHDDHITGTFDHWNPANQPDLGNTDSRSIEEILDDGDDPTDKLSEVRKEVQQLRELLIQTNKDGCNNFLFNRLTKIYNKI